MGQYGFDPIYEEDSREESKIVVRYKLSFNISA